MDKSKSAICTETQYHDLVNMTAHELKTPVSVLKAYLQIITKQLYRDNQLSYMMTLEKMEVQLDKVLHLISDLQDGVSTDNDDVHCLMNEFDINESVLRCFDNAVATHPDVTILYETDPSQPLVTGDRDRIEQVIHNLITNGIKYAGKQQYLKISSRVVEGEVIIGVTDKGPGIAPDLQEKIFQRFYRIQSDSTTSQSGLGLGLFICAQIIHKHQGRIGVISSEGMGSEFWFSLPVNK